MIPALLDENEYIAQRLPEVECDNQLFRFCLSYEIPKRKYIRKIQLN